MGLQVVNQKEGSSDLMQVYQGVSLIEYEDKAEPTALGKRNGMSLEI